MKLWQSPHVMQLTQRGLSVTKKLLMVVAILVGVLAAMLLLAQFSLNHTEQVESFSHWWGQLSPWLYLWRVALYGTVYWMWRRAHSHMTERHGAARVRRFGWRLVIVLSIVEGIRFVQIVGGAA